MEKQTAVEFLFEKIKSNIDPEDGSMHMNWLHDDTLNQAKEMEKQQIIDAHLDGQSLVSCKNEYAEQYYNETFKN